MLLILYKTEKMALTPLPGGLQSQLYSWYGGVSFINRDEDRVLLRVPERVFIALNGIFVLIFLQLFNAWYIWQLFNAK